MQKRKNLQITLQHQRKPYWPVSATFDSDGGLPYRQEGGLAFGENWATELRELTLQPDRYGEFLGKAVFRDGIRDITKSAASGIDPVHVFLNVEDPQLQALRWERLTFPDDDGSWTSFAQHQQLVFSCYSPSLASRSYPALNKHTLAALAFVASPLHEVNGYQPFDVGSMVDTLKKGIGSIPLTVMAEPAQATWEALREALNRQHYPILHIVAHGFYHHGESYLILLNEQQEPKTVSATTLIDELKRMDKLPNLIFLSSCETATPEASQGAHGHLARRLLDHLGTPAIIAMSDKVQIETARLLSEHFYTYLYDNPYVDVALAKASMVLLNRPDRHLPVLFQRLGNRPLFTCEAKPLNQLDEEDIKCGLRSLAGEDGQSGLLAERAPIMLAEYRELVKQLDTRYPAPAVLEKIDSLCQEITEMGFSALAQGEAIAPYTAICPFPGMRPFKASDSGNGTDYRQYFFGRDAKVQELVERLKQLDVLVIKGASGSGKSSIVYAGILPVLEKSYQERGDVLQTAMLRPRCIRNADQSVTSPYQQLQTMQQTLGMQQDVVIFVDQFEELFTTCQADDPQQKKQTHQQFLDALLGLPKQHPGWKVIITMRADFSGDCAPYENLRRVVQDQAELLPPMTLGELRTAIEAQVESVGLILERGLLHVILDEVEDQPGAMPLLQYLLWLLWKRRRGRYLRMEEYEKIQKVGNAISDIADSHYRQYDDNPLAQSYLRNIYLRLTRPDSDRQKQVGDGKYRDTRQRINQSELYPEGADPKLIHQLIQELADGDRRLVVTHEDEVEIAHETLIQHWRRLNSWLNDTSLNLIRQGIATAARDWADETNNRHKSSLLTHTGTRLEDIEQHKQKGLLFTNVQEEAYLQACHAEDRRRARYRKFVRYLSVVATVLMVIAGLLSAFAFKQKNQFGNFLAEQYFQQGIELRDNQYQEWGKAQQYFTKGLDATIDKNLQANLQFAYADLHRLGSKPIGVLMQHDKPIVGATPFAKDSRVLTWSTDGTARLWDASNGKSIGKPMQHDDAVKGATLFAGEKQVLTWSMDGSARMWNTSNGNPIGKPMQHGGAVEGVTLFDGETRLLTWGDGDKARLWDASNGNPIGKPMQHEEWVNKATLFDEETRILTWSMRGPVRLWDASNGNPIGKPMQHGGAVLGVTLCVGEKQVLTWSMDGSVQLWDSSNGNPIGKPMQHDDAVKGATLFAGEKQVLTWSMDGSARMWNTSNGNPIGKPMKHEKSINGATLLAGEKQVLTWSVDGTARLWDASNGNTIGKPMQHGGEVRAATLFAKETRVLTRSMDGTARLWDASNGEAIGKPMQHKGWINGATLFAGETRVLTWSADGTARLWDASNGNPIGEPMQHDKAVYGATLFAGETRVLTWSADGTARLWDISNGKTIGEPMQHERTVNGATLFTKEKRVLTWSEDGTARLWNTSNGNPIGEPIQHGEKIRGVTLSAEETRVLTWSENGNVRIWDASNGKAIGKPIQHGGKIRGVTLSAEETRVLTWSENGNVRIWDASNGKAIGKPIQHEGTVIEAPQFVGEARILTWSEDGIVRLWDANDGKAIGEPIQHEIPMLMNGVIPFAVGMRILTWSMKGTAQLWDASNGNAIGKPMQHKGEMYGVTLFAGEARILTWSADGTVQVWDASNGNPIGEPMKHDKEVYGATLFAGEARILTWSADGTARLWDISNGKTIGKPMQHREAVNGVALFAGETRVLTWSADGTAQVWDASSGKAVGEPMQHEKSVRGATLFAGDTRVLTWSTDGTAQLWSASSGKSISRPMRHEGEVNKANLFAGDTRLLTRTEHRIINDPFTAHTRTKGEILKIWELPTIEEKPSFLSEIKQSIQSQQYLTSAGDWGYLNAAQLARCINIYADFANCENAENTDSPICIFNRNVKWPLQKFFDTLPKLEDCLKTEEATP